MTRHTLLRLGLVASVGYIIYLSLGYKDNTTSAQKRNFLNRAVLG